MSYKSQPHIFNSLPDVDKQILAWCYNNNKTYIDGSKIYTGTINADKIKVNNLSSLSANLGSITGGSLNINNKFIVDSSGNATVDGKITARSGNIGGFELDEYKMTATTTKKYDFTMNDWDTIGTFFYGGVTPTQAQIQRYDLDGDGKVTDKDRSAILEIINAGNTLTTEYLLYPKFTTGANSTPLFEIEVKNESRVWIDKLGQFNANRGYFDYLFSNGVLLENKFAPMGAKTGTDGGAVVMYDDGASLQPTFYVPEIDRYKYFLVRVGNASTGWATWIFVPYQPDTLPSSFRGIGGFETESNSYGGELYFLRGTVTRTGDGGNVTIHSCWLRRTYNIQTNGSSIQCYIHKVIGVK